jgi:DnaJ family protein B protein 12
VFVFLLADVTAEELFNMFFGGGFPSQNVYVRRGGRWQRTAGHAEAANQREVSSQMFFHESILDNFFHV